jgi:putative ABC transport system permease protein
VGVVADTVFYYGQDRVPQIYEPFAQVPSVYLHFAVRTSGNPAAIVPALKPQIHAIDPNLAVPWAAPMTQTIGALSTLARQRFIIQLLALFSGIALVIAMVGIYGVISYSVSRRTTEIGIRMALGANVTDVLRLVLGQGARLVGLGLLLGLGGSIAAGHAIESMLYRTTVWDPVTLVLVVGILAGTALLACWLPARRATKVDPMVALRAE